MSHTMDDYVKLDHRQALDLAAQQRARARQALRGGGHRRPRLRAGRRGRRRRDGGDLQQLRRCRRAPLLAREDGARVPGRSARSGLIVARPDGGW